MGRPTVQLQFMCLQGALVVQAVEESIPSTCTHKHNWLSALACPQTLPSSKHRRSARLSPPPLAPDVALT